MKTARLLPALVAVAVVALATADASAMYNPATGTFLQRDAAGGPATRAGASGGIPPASGFAPRDIGPVYQDGLDLYLYVRANPARFVDPDGNAAQEPTTTEEGDVKGAAGPEIKVSVVAGGGVKPASVLRHCNAGAKFGQTIQGGGVSPRHFVLSQGCEVGTSAIVIQQIRWYGGTWKCSDLSQVKETLDRDKQQNLEKGVGWEWFGPLPAGQTGALGPHDMGPLSDDWQGAGYMGKGVFDTFGYTGLVAELKVYCLKDADLQAFAQANAGSHGHFQHEKIALWDKQARGNGFTSLVNVWNCCHCAIPQFNVFLDNLERQR